MIDDYPATCTSTCSTAPGDGGSGERSSRALPTDLRARGSLGVHLEVGTANDNAIAFYRHLGFEPVLPLEGSLLMGLRLD